ncbi:MAG TPA: YfhO family protein, partial [Thermoanaerobaculia bacterium]|nr:YfhO family protein [Thermoanaerobaculia bacterium]
DVRGATLTLAGVLVVITIGNVWIVRSNVVKEALLDWGEYRVFAEVALLAIAVLLFIIRIPQPTKVAALLGIILVQRFVSEGGTYHTFPASAAYPQIPILKPLENAPRPFRIVAKSLGLIPATATMYELEDVRGYQAMTYLKYALTYRLWCNYQPVWFNRVDDLTRPFLSFLNVRYAITWEDDAVPEGWREVARQRGSKLLENTRAIERAYVPRWVWIGMPDGTALNQMALESDFRASAWIHVPDDGKQYDRENGPGRVTIRDAKLGYEFDADMERDGWVVISELSWNGWRAYLDGRRLKLHLANTAFLSVHVPAGKHHVRLVYLPTSFVNGRWISLGTLFALVAVHLLLRFRRGPAA